VYRLHIRLADEVSAGGPGLALERFDGVEKQRVTCFRILFPRTKTGVCEYIRCVDKHP
jgi:hypothetical protein